MIGVPDEEMWGEAIGWMTAPKSVGSVADLPRSPVGKVLKRLRASHWQGRTQAVS